jgi:uncharacterized protein YbbC (DUF1343 family)
MLRILLAILLAAAPAVARVKAGIEVLEAQQFAPLKGKHVGLITNQTGITSDYRRTIDLLAKAPGVTLVAIFSPEHGITGQRDEPGIESGKDQATGIPIYSLFNGGVYRPSEEMMRGVDALVYDIQDVGARFYTYITTLGYMVEEAGRRKIPIYVLDRPNPINGIAVEGPLLDEKYFSFVGYTRMPIRHGMTVGELARMYNGENHLGADVQVIPVEGWQRGEWFDQTGLPWTNPSPNMRSLVQAILYPGVCLLEGRQVSVGRGTDTPFQMVGAPWFKSSELAEYLDARKIPGVSFVPRRFTPTDSLFRGQQCEGLEILLLDRNALNSVGAGIELVSAVMKLHPGKFDVPGMMRLLGSDATAEQLRAGQDPKRIIEGWQSGLEAFRKIRAKYLLY